jgi:GT2 family glycosyltransferase
MAPLGFINRQFFHELGGYDRNFVCGQSENDVVMRAIAQGGRVETAKDSKVFLCHAECHGEYQFSSGYIQDREFLENCWVKEGYGTYEKNLPFHLSSARLKPMQRFEDKDILTVNQGPAGRWA